MVLYKHALRNALIPLITLLALDLPYIFGGAIFVEILFAWPGMGRLYYQAALQRDYPVLMAVLIIGAGFIIFSNLLADIVYAYLDPRIRYELRSSCRLLSPSEQRGLRSKHRLRKQACASKVWNVSADIRARSAGSSSCALLVLARSACPALAVRPGSFQHAERFQPPSWSIRWAPMRWGAICSPASSTAGASR